MTTKTKKEAVSGLFTGLSEDLVRDFTHDLKTVKYGKGKTILLENESGACLYEIKKGRVEVSKALESKETPFAQLSEMKVGDFFGEMSLLTDSPRSCTVTALTDVELLEIPKDDFIRLSLTQPIVMFNLIRILSTRLRVTNERFTELMNEMIRKNRLMAIGMTASKIIHDIKTPLTVIVLTAQLIESLFPDSQEFTSSIVRQTKLVDELVRETLDYVKGTPQPILVQKVDMDAFLKDLKDTYGASLKSREIKLVVENKCSQHVYFDEERIRRVIINLLRNSSEAIEEKGEIRISANLASNWLQISVIDNGPGIPDSIASDLFKPFVTYGKPNGTGLGLPICEKMVQEHSGRMDYYPVQPHGARFDIRLPQNLN
ncbi:MAG: cyclic nucleotide-binding domain-containing protein [Candidatus Syntrophosphaera sp.]|nr:cyclic nucleotide-binding domain-containing protein [Candidatus Syntrophosphaera sp.]